VYRTECESSGWGLCDYHAEDDMRGSMSIMPMKLRWLYLMFRFYSCEYRSTLASFELTLSFSGNRLLLWRILIQRRPSSQKHTLEIMPRITSLNWSVAPPSDRDASRTDRISNAQVVVIGKSCKNVSEEEAMQYVAG
jgi:hypothetical protein